ncbi:MAG: TIGR04255 family protein [Verrucomicrobia bacterium]|jgi:uncharacterized protein (TIGR04255 family)|nr:TIGR04255 family protein [Verrucomicrobiota bacterium]
MSDTEFKLLKAPIIEAVLDIDCDMPPGREVAKLEQPAFEILRDHYPKLRTALVQMHQIEAQGDNPPKMLVRHAIQGFQFLHEDEKQLVQVRAQGFSFNRLAPYTSLDDYLPEIERTWRLFISVVAPVQIRTVRLRYINRILLPMPDSKVELEDYLKIGPRLPDEDRLTFTGFLNQHTAVEKDTGNQVNIVLTTQPPEDKMLPLIFDITVENAGAGEVENWTCLLARVQALRALKNRVFRNTLTERCLNLFQQP